MSEISTPAVPVGTVRPGTSRISQVVTLVAVAVVVVLGIVLPDDAPRWVGVLLDVLRGLGAELEECPFCDGEAERRESEGDGGEHQTAGQALDRGQRTHQRPQLAGAPPGARAGGGLRVGPPAPAPRPPPGSPSCAAPPRRGRAGSQPSRWLPRRTASPRP